MEISTGLVLDAMQFYKGLGYQPLTVPYVVSDWASAVTKPLDRDDLYHKYSEVYSGSAEQGVIQMSYLGNLSQGKWQALTPCVRDEPEIDDEHYRVFLKLELLNFDLPVANNLVVDACSFWRRQGVSVDPVRYPTLGTWDINHGDLELGSYGVRHLRNGVSFAYGTGLAEPRGTMAIRAVGPH